MTTTPNFKELMPVFSEVLVLDLYMNYFLLSYFHLHSVMLMTVTFMLISNIETNAILDQNWTIVSKKVFQISSHLHEMEQVSKSKAFSFVYLCINPLYLLKYAIIWKTSPPKTLNYFVLFRRTNNSPVVSARIPILPVEDLFHGCGNFRAFCLYSFAS